MAYRYGNRQQMAHVSTEKKNGRRLYQVSGKQLCFDCRHWGECAKGKQGRRVLRLGREKVQEKLEAQYKEAASQEIYARRKAKVERPF